MLYLKQLLRKMKAEKELEQCQKENIRLEAELMNSDNDKIIEELQEEIEDIINQAQLDQNDLEAHIDDLTPTGTIAIHLYNYNGTTQLKWVSDGYMITEHFKVTEHMEKDGLKYVLADYNLFLALEDIKKHFDNRSVTINSGYRSEAYNEDVGGVSNSKHLYGGAADIVVSGITPLEVYNYVKTNHKVLGIGGVGVYNTFTHIDTRYNGETLATWDKR